MYRKGLFFNDIYHLVRCHNPQLFEVEAEKELHAAAIASSKEVLAVTVAYDYASHISGITSYGIYATIDENHCEGMIPMRDIADDYYDFDEKNFILRYFLYNKFMLY